MEAKCNIFLILQKIARPTTITIGILILLIVKKNLISNEISRLQKLGSFVTAFENNNVSVECFLLKLYAEIFITRPVHLPVYRMAACVYRFFGEKKYVALKC